MKIMVMFWQKKIIFLDEAHFHIGGYVNKPNSCICHYISRGIIGPFFFENEQEETVTVNGDRYWAMLNEFFLTKIEEKNIGNIWFQQDSAPCYTAEATLDVLNPVFDDRIISRRADVVWPPWSCNLTPLDYYLFGAVKDKCYADKPETIDALKDNIREVNICR